MVFAQVDRRVLDAYESVSVEVDGVVGAKVGDYHGMVLFPELVHRQHLRCLLANHLRRVHLHPHSLLQRLLNERPVPPLYSQDRRLVNSKRFLLLPFPWLLLSLDREWLIPAIIESASG